MLRHFINGKPSELDEPIADLLTRMNEHQPETEEYQNALEALLKLKGAKTEEVKRRISPDTALIVGGNLLVAGLVIFAERSGPVISKAIGMLHRPKSPHL